ncbi:MAG: type II toxin-antitoxin system RelE/ParE family toxin [Verrucomicrobia bacterium]|nr:type II toxin-antitoxin system RelE/ParE family toxin [Verrucomicrobiota bacterium]
MSLALERAADFQIDFALRALWYVREAGGEVARHYEEAVDSALRLLCIQPELGRKRRFRHPKLQGLRSFPVQKPFNRLIVSYRVGDEVLQAVRLMHGARDLPRRLAEPPATE